MTRWMWGGVLTACLAISGCSGLGTLSRATAPTDLYTLTPKSTFSSGLPRISQQLLVSEPTASSAVNTDQVAVQPTPYQFEYLPRARWVDRAPVMLQTLLIESYENSGKVAAVGRSSVGLRPDYLIVSDLREFQARIPKVETEEVALEVHVMLNMKIVDNFDDRIIGSKSFEEILYAPSDDMDDVVLVFDNALGKAMRKSVEWSVKTIYSHQQRNPRPSLR
ncbi:ABC-type transport auxiliary lipoprotein family protein [Shimia sp.]|uniref:ABC-type transport auxiliary lipoprotein family protein n=1 Tax=Shimia sp. TaxID=1954381 RepID=UPI003BA94668